MKWLFMIPSVLLVAFLIILVIGMVLPARHSVTRYIRLKQRPETVFAILDDFQGQANWLSGILKVEPLPARDGKPAACVTLKWGNMRMIMTQLERTPSNRLVVGMAKENGIALGTWTYGISAEPGGCEIALNESGELTNPIFRIVARLRGLDSNITQNLRDLAKKFGEDAEVRAAR